MPALKQAIESVICDPKYAEYLAIVKAARNGAVYGAKVRFPHALVMIFLFRSGTIREKLRIILKATKTHAQNLATFAVIYKTIMLVLRHTPRGQPSTQKEQSFDPFLAGLVGGYFVFGRGIQSSVNQQIVIYVFARVVLAAAKMSVQEGAFLPPRYQESIQNNAWPVFASLSWACVMWLNRHYTTSLQPSLRSSMKYIYSDCDRWQDLRTFLWHNS